MLLGPCRTGPGPPVLRKVRSITGRQAGQPVMYQLNNKPEIGYKVCLFAVQFVNGGMAGSVIYGPYDFNPGSRRVHNALSCRSFPLQAAPLLLSAFHLCPFSFCFFPLISSPILSMPRSHLLLFIYKAMTGHFSVMDNPHLPGADPFSSPRASFLLFC